MRLILVTISFVFVLNSCKDDDEPDSLSLESLMAGSIDLNGATAPDNVPVSPTIVANFSTAVDEATATSSNISLVQDYDDTSIPLNISVSGNSVTISPTEPLSSGALYKLTFSDGLKAEMVRHLPVLNGHLPLKAHLFHLVRLLTGILKTIPDDQIGDFDPPSEGIVAISYVESRNEAAGMAASFDGSTSIIEIPNGDQLVNTDDFALSFWVHAISADHPQGHFVLGLAAFYGFQFEISGDYSSCKLAAQYELADGSTAGEDLAFNGDGKNKDNGRFCRILYFVKYLNRI
ncbi:MAG: Ig-like domain-containing protein, partial [Bacteroidales bacterium]|nr:Ig-like domain-containing protein [Bacteroidales bacterium]